MKLFSGVVLIACMGCAGAFKLNPVSPLCGVPVGCLVVGRANRDGQELDTLGTSDGENVAADKKRAARLLPGC